MKTFNFTKEAHLLGKCFRVDYSSISVLLEAHSKIRNVEVGKLVYIGIIGAGIIGIIDEIRKLNREDNQAYVYVDEFNDESTLESSVYVVAEITMLGVIKDGKFTRSLVDVPRLDSECYALNGENISKFMRIISFSSDKNNLHIGKYVIDETADAYLDGNKFFQRHAAILGSTGSGKSWTVASLLEKANKLPNSNVIVFDLHGEYKSLSFAKRYTIPSPSDKESDNNLYLPYWLLNSNELQAMFLSQSEHSAHNQVSAFNACVLNAKIFMLTEPLNVTINSPVPFDIRLVVEELKIMDTELEPGAKAGTTKKGKFYGQFSRLISRIENKINDSRYNFMFADGAAHVITSMKAIARQLINDNIKIIDFSEVPEEILPMIISLVARIIYNVQFWTDKNDRYPIVLVCDEAHIYLPKKDRLDPSELQTVETFEKIAKEGRKYGVSLLVVSQRPSDISETILSQCNNILALRLTNATDQATVRRFMPDSFSSILNVLPILNIGECIVVGDSVLLPTRIKQFIPTEKPLSGTVDFWDEWSKEKPRTRDLGKAISNMIMQRK